MAKDPAVVELSYENFLFKYGRNPAVGAALETIWDGSGAYTGWIGAEAPCEIVSDSVDDDTGGGGAVTIRIVGQGDDGLEITEDKDLNGVGAEDLANEYAIIYRAWAILSEDDSEVTGPNHGTITIRKKAGPVIMAVILPTYGSTLMCVYRIPSNKYGELVHVGFSANEGKEAEIRLVTRKNRTIENAWRTMVTFNLFENVIEESLRIEPQFLYPGADIIATAKSAAAGVIVSGHFAIRLYDL